MTISESVIYTIHGVQYIRFNAEKCYQGMAIIRIFLKKSSLKTSDTCTKSVLLVRILFFLSDIGYYNTRGDQMIRNHLSKLLGERRWTQADLARKTGIRRATINEMYNELSDRINLEYLDRICEVLNCDISDILEYIPNPQRKTGQDLILEDHGNRHKK